MQTDIAAGRVRTDSRRRAIARRGWSLVELVVATAILIVVLVGFSFGVASSTALGRADREQVLVQESARAMLERLRTVDFEDVFACYNANPDDDPEGVPSPGTAFDVPGLNPLPEDPDGRVGLIVFPVSEDGELREDLELERLGMPRDLTGDGGTDDVDHSADYRLLPVLVRVEWAGAAGDARLEMGTILKRMSPEVAP